MLFLQLTTFTHQFAKFNNGMGCGHDTTRELRAELCVVR